MAIIHGDVSIKEADPRIRSLWKLLDALPNPSEGGHLLTPEILQEFFGVTITEVIHALSSQARQIREMQKLVAEHDAWLNEGPPYNS